MTEFLLVLIINAGSNGVAITTVKVPDSLSCIRAGEMHKNSSRVNNHRYECTQITKVKNGN